MQGSKCHDQVALSAWGALTSLGLHEEADLERAVPEKASVDEGKALYLHKRCPESSVEILPVSDSGLGHLREVPWREPSL